MPEEKKNLKAIPWVERTGLNLGRVVRMVKMIAPVCNECRIQGGKWWENCPHDPYHSVEEITERSPILERDEKGGALVKGYEERVVYKEHPNVRQVGLHTRIRSGLGVDAQLVRGWKFPQDVNPNDGVHEGYAPMCEFNNCYSSNPKIKTRNGAFCSRDHAALVTAKAQGKIMEALDREKFRKQIEEVNIG